MRLHLIPNSHIDPVWLWDKQEGIDEVLNTFRSACDRLDEFPDLTFSASSLQFYEWVKRYDTHLFERICGYVADSRWEVVGGWWIEPDTNLPLEASFAKHAEISQRTAQEYFGRQTSVAFLPDTFGHPAALPKVLAQTGFRYFLFCRPNETEKDDLPGNLFYWEYEGHRVLTYRPKHHYTQVVSHQADQPDVMDGLAARLEDEEYQTCPVNGYLFGVGDHGGGPTRREIAFYNEFLAGQPAGDAGYSSCQRFFQEAEANPNIPVYQGDLHRHAVGCYSVVRALKVGVRQCEHGLQHAARALAMNGESDGCLTEAWKTTLFNQFHDILPGSSSPAAAAHALAELGGVESFGRETAYAALRSLSSQQQATVAEGEYRVFNTLPFPVTVPIALESFHFYREGAFLDSRGRAIEIQEIVPSVVCSNRRWEFIATLPAEGFQAYHFAADGKWEDPQDTHIHYRPGDGIWRDGMQIAADGTVSTEGSPLCQAPTFLVIEDDSDTWGHGVERYDTVAGEFSLLSSSVLSGPVPSKLYQRWTYGHSTLDVIYSLYTGQPGIFIDLAVGWVEKRKMLKMEILPVAAHAMTFTMQGAGGTIERPADGKEQPLHHWLSLPTAASNLTVVQDGMFACDCLDGRLRLTLVRSNIYGYFSPYPPDPDDPRYYTDQGEHRMRLQLSFGRGGDSAHLDRLAQSFVEPYSVLRECPRGK